MKSPIAKLKLKSRMYRSLVIKLRILPTGVTSKNRLIGALKIYVIKLSCKDLAALRPMNKRINTRINTQIDAITAKPKIINV